MKNDLLKSTYSPESFRKKGHELVDQLADHLEVSLNNKSEKVIHWKLPDDEYEFYIVQTKLRGIHYLRTTIMNPFTTKKHLKQLLAKVKEIAKSVTTN